MPTQITVTPGATVTDDTRLTTALLNLLGNPKVEIPDGLIPGESLDTESVVSSIGDALRGQNLLPFGNMWPENFSTPGGVTATAAAKTLNALSFYCEPAGANVTYSRVAAAPDKLSSHAIHITGATSATGVYVGTYLGPDMAGQTYGATLTLSVYLYNGTGAVFTPSLVIESSNSLADRASVTEVYNTASSQSNPTAEWVRHSWVIDANSLSNFKNGAELKLLIPSGSLDAGSKFIYTTQWQLEVSSAATAYIRPIPYAIDIDTVSSADAPSDWTHMMVQKSGVRYKLAPSDFGARLFMLDEDADVTWDVDFSDAAVAHSNAQPTSGTLARPAAVPTAATHLILETWLDGDIGSITNLVYTLNIGNSAVADATFVSRIDLNSGSADEQQVVATVTRKMNGSGNIAYSIDQDSVTGTGTDIGVKLKIKVVGYIIA